MDPSSPPAQQRRRWRARLRRVLVILVPALLFYGALAYLLLPSLWRHYEHQKKLDGLPMVTSTAQGIPGDPINIGMVGSAKDILCAMHAAGWYAADKVTWRSGLEISGSVIFDRPYPTAPVSPLYYAGRVEDFAFERPVGKSADQRHHVRLWKVLEEGDEGRPVWLGAATFDRSVGFSHYTAAITHHIAPDVDAERTLIANDLESAGMLAARYQVMGLGPTLLGRNGGGDPYFTDGEVWVLRLVENCARRSAAPEILPDPPAIAFKDAIWNSVAGLYRSTAR
ncbi:MAG: LssY C-terminal domain-containing protein [Rhizobiales bacterium]|nr:LssY C-terminal domain-containing protein [Hyphomicrobiales bacterium]